MLTLLTGKTGSGKSYKAVSSILDYINSCRKVFTNIKIDVVSEYYYYIDELDVKNFLLFIEETFKNVDNLDEKKEEIKKTIYINSVFMIDEAHLVGFKDKKESILNWLTIHRHFNQDIFIITQVSSNLHRDYLFMFHSHIEMIDQNKRLLKDSMGYREYDSYKGDRRTTKYFKPNKDVFEIYNTGSKETGYNKDVIKILLIFVSLMIAGFILYDNLNHMLNRNVKQDVNITAKKGIKTKLSDNKVKSIKTNVKVTVMCSKFEGCDYKNQYYTHEQFIFYVFSKAKDGHSQVIAKLNDGNKFILYSFIEKD